MARRTCAAMCRESYVVIHAGLSLLAISLPIQLLTLSSIIITVDKLLLKIRHEKLTRTVSNVVI